MTRMPAKPMANPRDDGGTQTRVIQTNPRAGWDADAQRTADQGADAPVWPEFVNASDDEIVWE